MKIELLLGGMTNLETSKYGNPSEVISNIKKAKNKNIDVLIGPEWSLTCSPRLYTKKMTKNKEAEVVINALFNAPDYMKYAPKDAKKILEEEVEEGFERFYEVPSIPYSEREYKRVLNDLTNVSKGSDMLIFPGTAMFYDEDRVLYNVMPILRDGKIVKNIYKFNDGLGSKFNLENALELYPYNKHDRDNYSLSYGKTPIINFRDIKVSAEICADAGILKKYGVKDLDLQILSSCGNNSTDRIISKQGYLAIVDGFKSPIVHVSGKYIPKLKPLEASKELQTFKLEFNV
ncbi:MAG: hypothetical protein BJBARM4_0898 [Candidatus Parvarchaeum acidiphilum ARMAN-4]|jgi:hypothetical protein|uniref:CN hydrolase domain-containing protein n=1 Tax=Candidatus Parvarchaeum acidiphilum ARMAN-4 TaxID=662760 RepID=D2EGJ9_PARA4|nr:MAG: hypothetical protein BJBARM4_0898 [Candidatus Parvarchaeum acidiphilum ARMAN-4]